MRTAEEWDAHNKRCDDEYESEHGPDSHACTGEAPCYEDPECQFAICETCGQPNKNCMCDFLYEQSRDK